MFIIGHAGITLGLGWLLDLSLQKKYGPVVNKPTHPQRNAGESSPYARKPLRGMAKLAYLIRRMDYRLLILGSLLPDIIDKPLGHWLFPDFFHNSGRIFAHSMLFLIIIGVIGIAAYRIRRGTGLLVLSSGIAMHLLTDAIWDDPKTALWPFLGWDFEAGHAGNFWSEIWESFTGSPYAIASEAIVAVIIIAFLIELVRKKHVYSFLRYGRR